MMKILFLCIASLLLTGCSSPLTRLMPKLDKIELPEELMKPPQELKIIVKPNPPTEAPADVPPE